MSLMLSLASIISVCMLADPEAATWHTYLYATKRAAISAGLDCFTVSLYSSNRDCAAFDIGYQSLIGKLRELCRIDVFPPTAGDKELLLPC